MATVGSLGDVIFEVSSRSVKTFDEMSRSGSGRWANHDIDLKKPEPEFLGPGQDEIRFSVRLDAAMGVNPLTEIKKLRKMRDTGVVSELIIGGEPTENLWLLESIQEDHKTHTGDGKLICANIQLTLKEYPRSGGKKK